MVGNNLVATLASNQDFVVVGSVLVITLRPHPILTNVLIVFTTQLTKLEGVWRKRETMLSESFHRFLVYHTRTRL
jgi:hypothetical protein